MNRRTALRGWPRPLLSPLLLLLLIPEPVRASWPGVVVVVVVEEEVALPSNDVIREVVASHPVPRWCHQVGQARPKPRWRVEVAPPHPGVNHFSLPLHQHMIHTWERDMWVHVVYMYTIRRILLHTCTCTCIYTSIHKFIQLYEYRSLKCGRISSPFI